MTYIRRAFKYFIQLTLLFAVIVGVLMLIGYVPKDIAVAFRNGWDSIFLILGIFAFMSLVYPFFGYGKRNIHAKGDPATLWPQIDEALSLRGYVRGEDAPDGGHRYHLRSAVNRAARLWEDTLTLTPQLGGFQAEGLVRDLARAVMAIDHKINRYE